jgi:hypothetical protein
VGGWSDFPGEKCGLERDRIAAAIVAAFEDEQGRRALRRATAHAADPAVTCRLRRGLAAVRVFRRRRPPERPLVRTLAQAAALFRAGLFFEVHELLERAWRGLAGPPRSALQGLIQVAVAMHHLANGNARGARAALAKGRANLERYGAALPAVDVARLLRDLVAWERTAADGRWPSGRRLPSVRVATGPRRGITPTRGRPPSA